jgi:AcrR family transcriptional regulator
MKTFTDRQMEIINAAIDLIADKGIQQMTIKNLSAKIGFTEGAIYRHFDSKIEILLGILAMFKDKKNSALTQLQSSTEIFGRNLSKRQALISRSLQDHAGEPGCCARRDRRWAENRPNEDRYLGPTTVPVNHRSPAIHCDPVAAFRFRF